MLSNNAKTNWLILLLSVIVAIGLWYNISVYDKIVAQVEVRIDYKGKADNLVVLKGMVSSIKVRMRGPKTLIRAMTSDDLTYVVDLSKMKKGIFVIPFVVSVIDNKMRAIEVLEISPPQLDLVVDSIVDRVVKLVPKFKDNFKNRIIAAKILKITPVSITLHGPLSFIGKIKTLPLSIPIDSMATPGLYSRLVSVTFPHSNLVIAKPHKVKVEYKVISKRKNISLMRKINLGAGMNKNILLEPSSFVLELEVPEELANDKSYLNKVYLSAIIGNVEEGMTVDIPLKYELPEGMVLLSPLPKKIKVTKIKQLSN